MSELESFTKHVSISVSGLVQGVFFRACTKDQARQLGLKGFVRNEPNGSVYIEAEGNENDIETFIKWCHVGSPNAKVSSVEMSEGEMRGFEDFTILAG